MKRIVLAIVLATAIGGGVFASATTLGGLTDKSIGANTTAVAACDANGVTSSYGTTYNATSKKYDATTVVVGDIAAGCVGKTVKVTMVNAAGASLFEGSKTVAGTSETFTVAAGTPAETVDSVAVTVFG